MANTDVKKKRAFDPRVFWISAGLTAAFVVWAAVFPDNMNKVINGVFNWTTGRQNSGSRGGVSRGELKY